MNSGKTSAFASRLGIVRDLTFTELPRDLVFHPPGLVERDGGHADQAHSMVTVPVEARAMSACSSASDNPPTWIWRSAASSPASPGARGRDWAGPFRRAQSGRGGSHSLEGAEHDRQMMFQFARAASRQQEHQRIGATFLRFPSRAARRLITVQCGVADEFDVDFEPVSRTSFLEWEDAQEQVVVAGDL